MNFAAADTGTLVLVTNEGNGRFCTTLPRVHVAVMPVEKVIPRLADVGVLLPLLTTHATGQALSNYVTMISGPRRAGEVDGPDELHVVFLDNRRRTLLGTKYEEMLACIRCGACLNVCPVYRNVSGHAYDAVYSGPMGKVLTPLLSGGAEGADLPYGSTLCHACSDACPVKIPLGDMILALRADVPDAAHRARGAGAACSGRCGRARGRRRAATGSRPRSGRVSRGRVPGLRALDVDARAAPPRARVVPRSLGRGAPLTRPSMLDTLVADLRANSCTVSRPDGRRRRARRDRRRASRVARSSRATPTCRSPGLVDALAAHGVEVLDPDDPAWAERLPDVAVGITGRAARGRGAGRDRARRRAGFAARDEPRAARARLRRARRRRRRDPRRRDDDDRRGRAAERAHVDRRPEPHRRPRDDHDARRARPACGRGRARSRDARVGATGKVRGHGDRRRPLRRSHRLPPGRGARRPASTSPARSSRPRCPAYPAQLTPHLVVLVRAAAGTDGNATLETVFVRDSGEEIGRNRQTFFVEPGKFGYRLVQGRARLPGPGTVEARCTIVESGSAVTVPLTALPLPPEARSR